MPQIPARAERGGRAGIKPERMALRSAQIRALASYQSVAQAACSQPGAPKMTAQAGRKAGGPDRVDGRSGPEIGR